MAAEAVLTTTDVLIGMLQAEAAWAASPACVDADRPWRDAACSRQLRTATAHGNCARHITELNSHETAQLQNSGSVDRDDVGHIVAEF